MCFFLAAFEIIGFLPIQGEIMSKYTDRIKELRKEKMITQTQLATELGLSSPSRLRMWESGASEPSIDMLVRIAEYFQVSVDYLISRTNERNDNFSELVEKKLSSETANTYRLFIIRLNHELVKWENHPLISGSRVSSYLQVLSHDLSILRWVATKPTEAADTECDGKNWENTTTYKLPQMQVPNIIYPKQKLELLCLEHNNRLQQLLTENYLGIIDYFASHPEIKINEQELSRRKVFPYGNS